MNLLFDLTASQPNDSGKKHGGGKYCEMLFLAMCARKESFKAFYDSTRYINPIILSTAKQSHIKLFDINTQNLCDIVSIQGITHLYSALPELISPWPDCKILGTIHGLRNYEMPFDFFSNWQFDQGLIGFNTLIKLKNSLKEKKIQRKHYQDLLQSTNFSFVTDSCHSSKIILSLSPRKNFPIFFPPSTASHTIPQNTQKHFFLLVSANRIEKNCIRAIIALDQLYSKQKIPPELTVKVTGLSGPNFRYRLKNPKMFEFLGYVEDSSLAELYSSSWCFIYPSLNEGFGYPPIEAMQYGVPVIASNTSSIPEVCGSAALYINPKSIINIKKRIQQVCEKKYHEELSKKSLHQFDIVTRKQHEDTQKLIDWITSQD